MTNSATATTESKMVLTPEQIKKNIENHKTAAKHHEDAAMNHHEAAKHREDGNHEKAAHSTIIAYGHHALASETQKENVKNHALISKK